MSAAPQKQFGQFVQSAEVEQRQEVQVNLPRDATPASFVGASERVSEEALAYRMSNLFTPFPSRGHTFQKTTAHK